jgi:hypothetical protein
VAGEGGETAKAGQAKIAPPSANAAPIFIKGCTIVFGLLEGRSRPGCLALELGRIAAVYSKSRAAVIVTRPPLDPSCRYL